MIVEDNGEKMLRNTILFFICLLISSCHQLVNSNTLEVQSAIKSVVKVSVEYSELDNTMISSVNKKIYATGFSIVNDPLKNTSYVITNKHVCILKQNATYALLRSNGDVLKATFITDDEFADLCILKADGVIPPLELSSQNASQGEKILTIGSPAAVFPLVVEGLISGYHNVNSYMVEDSKVFELHFRAQVMSAPIYAGSSGSPVLNSDGKVVGVVYAVANDKEHISFIVPVSELLRFIDKAEYVSIG